MTYDPETYSIPEIARLLRSLKEDMEGLRGEVKELAGTFVSRGEFEAWRTAYNREIADMKKDLSDHKAASAPVRTSGWTIAGFGLSAVVGLGSLLGLAITLINVIP